MRIAVTGTRGVPATHGGVEHQCEEIYSRLAAQGHDITIYVRSHYVARGIQSYRGMTIKRLPTINTKYSEALVHTFLATLHILKENFDIVHYYGQGPCLFSPLVRLFRPSTRIFFTCGGLDWQRKKWPSWASGIIYLGEVCSARYPHYRIVVSRDLQHYYRSRHHKDSFYIPNGVDIPAKRPIHLLRQFGLSERGYFLFVGRLVPEKRIEDLILAYQKLPRRSRLVIVGDSAGTDGYVRKLKKMAGAAPSILFAGYQFGESLGAFYSNALAFVSASELEGLPLTLLEALSHGLPCICSDIAPHREILGVETVEDLVFPTYDTDALSEKLQIAESMAPDKLNELGARAAGSVGRDFSWDAAASSLAQLYRESRQTERRGKLVQGVTK